MTSADLSMPDKAGREGSTSGSIIAFGFQCLCRNSFTLVTQFLGRVTVSDCSCSCSCSSSHSSVSVCMLVLSAGFRSDGGSKEEQEQTAYGQCSRCSLPAFGRVSLVAELILDGA